MTAETMENKIELVESNTLSESNNVCAALTRAIEQHRPLFFARFLTDIPAMSNDPVVNLLRNGPPIVLRQFGRSCHVNAWPPIDEVARTEIGLEESETALLSGQYDVLLLDQILTAVNERLLSLEDVKRLAEKRPPHVRLILTGNKIPAGLLAMLSNEMLHPTTIQ